MLRIPPPAVYGQTDVAAGAATSGVGVGVAVGWVVLVSVGVS
jgi:hypothetical protein